MADTVIDIPGVGPVAFPDSMTEAQINAASTRLYKNANVGAKQPPVTSWVDSVKSASIASPESTVGLPLTLAAKAVPLLANAAEEVATNPAVPAMAAKAGRAVGAVVPIVKAGPLGMLASGKGAWAGGKGGWFAGKLAQDAAGPVANALNTAKPYVEGAATTLAGAQGALDLAQMAEPGRRDIGTLGVGKTVPDAAVQNAAAANQLKWLDRQANHEGFGASILALPKADAIDAVQKIGLSRGDATRVVMNLRVWSGMN